MSKVWPRNTPYVRHIYAPGTLVRLGRGQLLGVAVRGKLARIMPPANGAPYNVRMIPPLATPHGLIGNCTVDVYHIAGVGEPDTDEELRWLAKEALTNGND